MYLQSTLVEAGFDGPAAGPEGGFAMPFAAAELATGRHVLSG